MRSFIVLLCAVISLNNLCMESQALPIIPVEVLVNFHALKDKECIKYNMQILGTAGLSLPWTITPILVKASIIGDSLDIDLTNPEPKNNVLINPQLWSKNTSQGEFVFRLSEDIHRTNDSFTVVNGFPISFIYDGINKQNKAVVGCKWARDWGLDKFYCLYMFTQSDTFGETTHQKNYQYYLQGNGTLRSLMLEDERNRCVYSVDMSGVCYKLFIKDFDVTQEHPYGSCNTIAEIITPELFTKTVCLKKDTYFGITELGNLYSIWLDDNNGI